MLQHSVGYNINIASLLDLRALPGLPFLSAGKRAAARRGPGRASSASRRPSISTKVASLSGGNQQKALIARWLSSGVKLLILDEPSRGVDVGAREEIHDAIRALARSGVGIIVISSDVEELAILADRVLVMREGHISGELTGAEITEASIIELSYHDAEGPQGRQRMTAQGRKRTPIRPAHRGDRLAARRC